MRKYRRIAFDDRCQIRVYLENNVSKAEIARRLNFHKSTISRELKRNSTGTYSASSAQRKAQRRFESCKKPLKVANDLAELIIERLRDDWSPEQISGRLKVERSTTVSVEAIYRFIRADKKNGGTLFKLLRRPVKRGASRYYHRYKRPELLNIKLRDKEAQSRSRIGDWERDCMLGLKSKKVLVCVDRKTRFIKLKKLKTSKIIEVGQVTNDLIRGLPLHTITNDNGTEFRDHIMFECPVYYCDPGKPNQRGTVENTIGLLRQYISRTTDLNKIDDGFIQNLENKLNNRPRKCLDYKTPIEVITNTKVALAM